MELKETNRTKHYPHLSPDVRTKFMNNMVLQYGPAYAKHYMDSECQPSFDEFIGGAFSWLETDEGSNYWSAISRQSPTAKDKSITEDRQLTGEYKSVPSITQEVILNLKRELAQAHETIQQQQIAYELKKPTYDRERSWEFVRQRMVSGSTYKSELLIKYQDVFNYLSKLYYPPTPFPKRDETN